MTQQFRTQGLTRGATTLTFLLGIFMGALDHGIVGPALSSIMAAYDLEASWGVWNFTMYTLLFAVSIPVLGKLSDRFGRKQTFAFGIAMFACGSLVAAWAPNFAVFLVGRALQAIGTGGIFPITAAQIAVTYPPERRGRMMGLIGMVFGLGTILGPVLGGLIVAQLAWQWIFLVNVPIAAIILILTANVRQEQQTAAKPVDLPGILVLTLLILTVMLGITLQNVLLLACAVVIIPVLVLVERRSSDPIMRAAYFTRARTLVLLLASSASGFVMASAMNLIPYYSETVLGMDKGDAGMSAAPLAAASVLASLAGGYMVDKAGAKRTLLLGFGIALAGTLALAIGTDGIGLFYLVSSVLGFGIGIVIGAPLNVLILQAVEVQETGAAVGYVSLFRSFGSTMGPSIAGLLLAAYESGFQTLFLISAAVSGASMALLILLRRNSQ